MIPSPLQLDDHFFTHVEVHACEHGCTGEYAPEITPEYLQHPEETRRWMVVLTVAQEKVEDNCPPYSFKVSVVGLFHVADDYPEDKLLFLVGANAPAVLYGAAREMVESLTARGPHPQVKLPTVSFIDHDLTAHEEERTAFDDEPRMDACRRQ